MIARRRSPRRSKASPPANGSDRTAVLLEEVRAQNQMVLEAVVAHRETTDRAAIETKESLGSLDQRLGRVEASLTLLSSSTAERFRGVDERFRGVDERFRGLETHMDEGFARVESSIDGLRQDGRELAELVARKADAATLTALDQRVTLLERRARV